MENSKQRIRAFGAGRVLALLCPIVAVAFLISLNLIQRQKDDRLIEAARRGDVQAAESLLAHGANIEARQGQDTEAFHWRDKEYTPLALAVARGNEAMVRMLLAYHANVSAKTAGDDRFPARDIILTNAAEHGTLEIVRLLLEKGADVNTRAGMNFTPLMGAANYNHPAIAQLLIEKGADVNVRDDRGWTALYLAQGKHKQDHSAMIRLLQKAGAH